MGKLKLSILLREHQLLDLINLCISCKIPWAPFALTCFLQDCLDSTIQKSDDVEMETDSLLPTMSWMQNGNKSGSDITVNTAFLECESTN